jgi:tRNA threonylcarbamoyladenosine biosynthesis protein TsaE
MRVAEVVTRSGDETERVGEAIAGALRPGDVVFVEGDVGAGKTTFVRGACRRLGVSGTVSSPSFTIAQRYEGRVPVAHVDLFRLDSLAGEDPGLLMDYFEPDTITFVEWPKGGLAAVGIDRGHEAATVKLAHLGGDERALSLSGRDEVVARMQP